MSKIVTLNKSVLLSYIHTFKYDIYVVEAYHSTTADIFYKLHRSGVQRLGLCD